MAKTFTVTLSGQARHDGVRYKPGDEIAGLTDVQVARLKRARIVADVREDVVEPPAPPVVIDGPELIVGMTVKEAVEALALLEDTDFIGAVIEAEKAKGDPRKSLIEAAETRISELVGGEGDDSNPDESDDHVGEGSADTE